MEQKTERALPEIIRRSQGNGVTATLSTFPRFHALRTRVTWHFQTVKALALQGFFCIIPRQE
ncbi:hypothetical protein CXU14_09100 [Akkermansia muciniphila]|nr:hypothetical protein CXU16_09740 [Akkermansia muciniphila]PNC31981.1 hypothetical protein CXU17_00455 [Akkermansia muciniphila]PNC33339.1 hypothetical protein CXU12_12235 [Akkermansia muciniphila]PNC43921.1 hypothetical protein CXU14_09100 [Akkermansia muciniphila]